MIKGYDTKNMTTDAALRKSSNYSKQNSERNLKANRKKKQTPFNPAYYPRLVKFFKDDSQTETLSQLMDSRIRGDIEVEQASQDTKSMFD